MEIRSILVLGFHPENRIAAAIVGQQAVETGRAERVVLIDDASFPKTWEDGTPAVAVVSGDWFPVDRGQTRTCLDLYRWKSKGVG